VAGRAALVRRFENLARRRRVSDRGRNSGSTHEPFFFHRSANWRRRNGWRFTLQLFQTPLRRAFQRYGAGARSNPRNADSSFAGAKRFGPYFLANRRFDVSLPDCGITTVAHFVSAEDSEAALLSDAYTVAIGFGEFIKIACEQYGS
jgi:hypothetical protein